MTKEEKRKEIQDKLAVIVEAYEAGYIKLYKVATYQGNKPKEHHTWWLIKYIVDNKIVYDGAYELKKGAELTLGANVHRYLLIQLATQL